MKSSLFALFILMLGTSLAVSAQSTGKKPAKPATPGAAANDAAKPRPKPSTKSGDADEPAADDDDNAEKKTGKKTGAIKLNTRSENDLIKALSYMQGLSVGRQIAQFEELGIQIDMDVLLDALQTAAAGKEPTMSDEEMQDAGNDIQKLLQDKFASKNKREGEAFLAENKKEEGVKTLPSGLQYKVLKSGKGESPKKTDSVQAHYQGTFLNGQVFDSSYRRGQPASFPVTGVIAGWTEALQLMKVGDKWKLFVPANLAYKETGMHDPQGREIIPPNATLVFEVELLGVQKGSKLPSLK